MREARLGRSRNRAMTQSQQRPQMVLLGALEQVWAFRDAPNWGEKSRPVYRPLPQHQPISAGYPRGAASICEVSLSVQATP